jgi:hypothetical protein
MMKRLYTLGASPSERPQKANPFKLGVACLAGQQSSPLRTACNIFPLEWKPRRMTDVQLL